MVQEASLALDIARGHLRIIQPLSREQDEFPSLCLIRLTFDKLALMLSFSPSSSDEEDRKSLRQRRKRKSRFSNQCYQKARFLSSLQTAGNEYNWMCCGFFWKLWPKKTGVAQLLYTKTCTKSSEILSLRCMGWKLRNA